jgi:AhpD family alkylhydroperoxidase
MASSTRVSATEITGIYGALLKTMSRRMLGQVPDAAGVMWHYPAVFKDLMGFGRKVDSWNRLDRNLASFATMAAAGVVGCSFCLDLHYFMTHNRGLDEVKAREVPRWRESTAFTPLERRVMEYAEAMSQTPLAVTDEMSAALLADLGAPALLELTARIGAINMTARGNVSLGIRSQEFSASCGLPPLATASTDGVASA